MGRVELNTEDFLSFWDFTDLLCENLVWNEDLEAEDKAAEEAGIPRRWRRSSASSSGAI